MSKYINLAIGVVIAILVLFVTGYSMRALDAVRFEGSGIRNEEGSSIENKELICVDSKKNNDITLSLYGKTGCVTEGEFRIKKIAADEIIQRATFVNLSFIFLGFFLVFSNRATYKSA